MKWALFVDVKVWIGCFSMKWALFVDVEVWIGCFSMKWVLFVDVEVRSGCSDGPSPRLLHPQVDQGHPRDKGGGTIASGVWGVGSIWH